MLRETEISAIPGSSAVSTVHLSCSVNSSSLHREAKRGTQIRDASLPSHSSCLQSTYRKGEISVQMLVHRYNKISSKHLHECNQGSNAEYVEQSRREFHRPFGVLLLRHSEQHPLQLLHEIADVFSWILKVVFIDDLDDL